MIEQARASYAALRGESNYFLYLASVALTRLGDSIDALAYSWIAYQLTGSAAWLTVIVGVNALPTVFLTPLLAPLVERWDKKRVMVLTGAFRAGMVLLTGALMTLGALTAMHLLLFTLCISISESFADPAYMASVPRIIPQEKLDAALSLRSAAGQAAQLVGTGVGGALIGLLGGGAALLADGALFALSALLISALRMRAQESPRVETAREGYFRTLRGGMDYFLGNHALVLLCLTGVGFNVLLGPGNQLMTAYVVETLRLDVYALSVAGVASSAGMLAGSALYPLVQPRLTVRRTVLWSFAAITLSYAAFMALGLCGAAWLKYAALFAVMFCLAVFLSLFALLTNVLFFKVVEESYLARMASIHNALAMLAVPAASLYSGTLVSVLPVPAVFGVTGALTLACTLALARMRTLRRLDDLQKEASHEVHA